MMILALLSYVISVSGDFQSNVAINLPFALEKASDRDAECLSNVLLTYVSFQALRTEILREILPQDYDLSMKYYSYYEVHYLTAKDSLGANGLGKTSSEGSVSSEDSCNTGQEQDRVVSRLAGALNRFMMDVFFSLKDLSLKSAVPKFLFVVRRIAGWRTESPTNELVVRQLVWPSSHAAVEAIAGHSVDDVGSSFEDLLTYLVFATLHCKKFNDIGDSKRGCGTVVGILKLIGSSGVFGVQEIFRKPALVSLIVFQRAVISVQIVNGLLESLSVPSILDATERRNVSKDLEEFLVWTGVLPQKVGPSKLTYLLAPISAEKLTPLRHLASELAQMVTSFSARLSSREMKKLGLSRDTVEDLMEQLASAVVLLSDLGVTATIG